MALYTWKNYGSDNSSELAEHGPRALVICELSFLHLPNEIKSIVKPFFAHYKTAQIPPFNKRLLIDLLALNSLDISLDEFITIGCALQSQWNDGLRMYEDDDLLNDFDLEKENYKSFLDILEKFLFAENHKDLHSVSFKFNSTGTIKVNNFFVLRDLYESICLGYDINKDNFQERKVEILSMANQVKLPKLAEKIKTDYAKALYCVLESKFSKDADILRFIGVFFHVFQVPTNNNAQTREILFDDISSTLGSIDIKNLRHYIVGRPSFLHI